MTKEAVAIARTEVHEIIAESRKERGVVAEQSEKPFRTDQLKPDASAKGRGFREDRRRESSSR